MCVCQGRSYRGFGGFGRTPHGPEKVPKNLVFFFFFFWAGSHAQGSVFVEKDERTPPTENKSCKTRHGTPKRRRRQRKPAVGQRARRGVARSECQTQSYRSVYMYSRTQYINGERPAAQTDKRTAQMPSCSVESCSNHYGSERAARTREKEGCQRELCVERVRLFAKKAIVVRRWPERDSDESAAARGRGQLFAIVPPATRTRRRKLFADVFIDSSEWLLVIFVPAGPQTVSPVLNDLARLRATAKFQITPACDFRESILIPFFFFWFACMSKVILSFRFYFCLGFPAGRRTGSVALDRDEAKSTSSAGVLESLLNLFWWPFLPLFHCEKECLSVPGIRRLFWVVFFLLAVHLVATTYGMPHQPTAKNRICRHRYTKVRFSRKNPPFYLKHVLKLRPCVCMMSALMFDRLFEAFVFFRGNLQALHLRVKFKKQNKNLIIVKKMMFVLQVPQIDQTLEKTTRQWSQLVVVQKPEKLKFKEGKWWRWGSKRILNMKQHDLGKLFKFLCAYFFHSKKLCGC